MYRQQEREVRKQFADYLNSKYDEWARKQRRVADKTLTKWAISLGVPVSTLSHYMNENRSPRGEVIYQLAASLGKEVLEITGQPPALPDDPNVMELVLLYMDPKTTDAQRQAALDVLANHNKPIADTD